MSRHLSFQPETMHFEQILSELGSPITTKEMERYLIEAVKSREAVKFEFTKNLSLALDLCVDFGKTLGLTREDISFLEYHDLEKLKLNVISDKELKECINIRKQQYAISRLIELPPLVQRKEDFYCFEQSSSKPNFITMDKAIGQLHHLDLDPTKDIAGKVILIYQADPGYDWLLGYGIAGLITKYGGANSHMAIRAAEIGLPAAIGVGDKLYEQIAKMKYVEIDCSNHTIREVQ